MTAPPDQQVRRLFGCATRGRTPCVVAETSSGYRIVIEAEDIARCHGDVQTFERELTAAARSQELVLGLG